MCNLDLIFVLKGHKSDYTVLCRTYLVEISALFRDKAHSLKGQNVYFGFDFHNEGTKFKFHSA